MLIVVAPSLITASSTRQRKSTSDRLPSSGLNSTSGQWLRANFTASRDASSTCSGVMRSFFSMCRALVAMKVWTRQALRALQRLDAARDVAVVGAAEASHGASP